MSRVGAIKGCPCSAKFPHIRKTPLQVVDRRPCSAKLDCDICPIASTHARAFCTRFKNPCVRARAFDVCQPTSAVSSFSEFGSSTSRRGSATTAALTFVHDESIERVRLRAKFRQCLLEKPARGKLRYSRSRRGRLVTSGYPSVEKDVGECG
jgi:hypothetical protein